MGTVACDPPEGWSKSAWRRADGGPAPSPACRRTEVLAVIGFRYAPAARFMMRW